MLPGYVVGKLNRWLWNESMGVYANVQSRGANRTSPRVSPFNFHPMITGAASVSQASTAQYDKTSRGGFF